MRIGKPFPTLNERFANEPRWYRILIRCRFLLAGVYLLSLAVVLGWVGLSALPGQDAAHIAMTIGIVLILVIAQAMLLAGAPQFHRARPARRRHKAVSLIAGAMAAGLLTFALICTITSLLGKTVEWMTLFGNDYQPFVVLIGLPWLFWLVIFGLLWFERWTTGFGRMYKLLIAGTFAELLFTVPVDVVVRRRTNCYCEEGTFAAFIFGGTTALWTFGPGVALLFLAVRFPPVAPDNRLCLKCGYDLRGLPEPRCPECGTSFANEMR